MKPTPKFSRRLKTEKLSDENWSSAEIKREMFRLGTVLIYGMIKEAYRLFAPLFF